LSKTQDISILLKIRANPKSQSFMTPCLVIRMFSGLTSRWMHYKKQHISNESRY